VVAWGANIYFFFFFFFWTRIVFLTGQVIFVLELPNGEFVSFYWLQSVDKITIL
jgi:hypothetical protein